ncbi:hypothetical protein DVB69_04115 [Sporosarcina sp. BI001-red]|uniref:hypothetical protein n=1 Tax=Sporosarcina sp. BI001-red TaxID=2282866 RepID=UPI000E2723E7|nr:hypothetical protein [Sporosarcina sp. BI001-red]REB09999.1 hypothetical protein DVB69_04115 [Sporosarcina sp. BI001-red]
MNAQRKRIIMSEIHYWKKNRLLPEHYCDFLITLYTQGDEQSATDVKVEKAILEKERSSVTKKMILLVILATGLCALMFTVGNYPIIMITVSSIFVLGLLIRLMMSKPFRSALIPFTYIIAAFMLLGISLKVWFAFFEGETMLLLGILMLNSILWLFSGRLLKLLYFTISGAAGLLMIIGFLLISY